MSRGTKTSKWLQSSLQLLTHLISSPLKPCNGIQSAMTDKKDKLMYSPAMKRIIPDILNKPPTKSIWRTVSIVVIPREFTLGGGW